jgi:hypothetical protein
MSNVILMFDEVLHDEPAAVFLSKAAETVPLDQAIVIGETEDGELFVGGNTGDFVKLVHLMFRANQHMNWIESHFPVYENKE